MAGRNNSNKRHHLICSRSGLSTNRIKWSHYAWTKLLRWQAETTATKEVGLFTGNNSKSPTGKQKARQHFFVTAKKKCNPSAFLYLYDFSI
jgi:hypothetical protein